MPAKKTLAKKPARRRSVAAKRGVSPVASSALVPEIASMPEPMPGPGTPQSRVIYFAGCKNCNHLPLSVNAIIAVLISIIFTLSAMLMASSVVPVKSGTGGTAAVATR